MQSLSTVLLLGAVGAFGLLAFEVYRAVAASHEIESVLYSLPLG